MEITNVKEFLWGSRLVMGNLTENEPDSKAKASAQRLFS